MFSTATLTAIRGAFPALARANDERAPAFFDGPGGTQVPRAVIDAIAEYLGRHNANTGGVFQTSRETDAMLDAAREAVADFLGARSGREIVFGANMTTLTFALSRALGAAWNRGDELIVSQLDHQANVATWQRLAHERGLRVHTVPFDPESLTLDLARLEELLSPRTRLVAVGAASNAVGTITDVRRVAELAHSAGALCFVDAVHLAPHQPIDVAALGCDFLACSAYKFFGPHVGILWGREELLERSDPVKIPPSPDVVPLRWETGTLNHEGIAGVAAAVDWIAEIGVDPGEELPRRHALLRAMERIAAHEAGLFAILSQKLADVPGVRLFSPSPAVPRTPTAAFTVHGHSPSDMAAHLAELGVYVWHGDFYASTVIERLGLDTSGGLIRAGLAAYNGPEDVERLVEGVRGLATR